MIFIKLFSVTFLTMVLATQSENFFGDAFRKPILKRKGRAADIFPCRSPGYYRNLENCQIFYRCENVSFYKELIAFEFVCPDNLVFDEMHKICNWPYLTPTCGYKKEIPTNIRKIYRKNNTIPQSFKQPKLKCRKSGFFKNNFECSKYYRCVLASSKLYELFEFNCPQGTEFDETITTCLPILSESPCSNVHSHQLSTNNAKIVTPPEMNSTTTLFPTTSEKFHPDSQPDSSESINDISEVSPKSVEITTHFHINMFDSSLSSLLTTQSRHKINFPASASVFSHRKTSRDDSETMLKNFFSTNPQFEHISTTSIPTEIITETAIVNNNCDNYNKCNEMLTQLPNDKMTDTKVLITKHPNFNATISHFSTISLNDDTTNNLFTNDLYDSTLNNVIDETTSEQNLKTIFTNKISKKLRVTHPYSPLALKVTTSKSINSDINVNHEENISNISENHSSIKIVLTTHKPEMVATNLTSVLLITNKPLNTNSSEENYTSSNENKNQHIGLHNEGMTPVIYSGTTSSNRYQTNIKQNHLNTTHNPFLVTTIIPDFYNSSWSLLNETIYENNSTSSHNLEGEEWNNNHKVTKKRKKTHPITFPSTLNSTENNVNSQEIKTSSNNPNISSPVDSMLNNTEDGWIKHHMKTHNVRILSTDNLPVTTLSYSTTITDEDFSKNYLNNSNIVISSNTFSTVTQSNSFEASTHSSEKGPHSAVTLKEFHAITKNHGNKSTHNEKLNKTNDLSDPDIFNTTFHKNSSSDGNKLHEVTNIIEMFNTTFNTRNSHEITEIFTTVQPYVTESDANKTADNKFENETITNVDHNSEGESSETRALSPGKTITFMGKVKHYGNVHTKKALQTTTQIPDSSFTLKSKITILGDSSNIMEIIEEESNKSHPSTRLPQWIPHTTHVYQPISFPKSEDLSANYSETVYDNSKNNKYEYTDSNVSAEVMPDIVIDQKTNINSEIVIKQNPPGVQIIKGGPLLVKSHIIDSNSQQQNNIDNTDDYYEEDESKTKSSYLQADHAPKQV